MAYRTYGLDQIRRLTATYSEFRRQPLPNLGRAIFRRRTTALEGIVHGGGCRAETAELITDWLDDNWPKYLP